MARRPQRPRSKLTAKQASARRSRAASAEAKTTRRGKPSGEKVKAYRERMRKRGMKLIQIWVPDPKSPYFVAEARRQSRLLAQSPHEKEDQAFIDSITDWNWD
jgi:Protein  of unknown function (DUF3018)/Late embryogenesis abundant protein